jgi:putative CocE/NonD family hydrolase
VHIPETRSAEYGIIIAKDVMIPMRDGVRLAADIYYPATDGERIDGPLPTILARTSYDKTNIWLWVEPVANFFAPRGYAVVVQDLRGRYKSEGKGQYFHVANPVDGKDGYDTIEWVAAQPWSNGKVGMVGSSHGAMTQTTAALENPPHLAAIWPDVGPINNYAHHIREGGAMQLHMFGAQFLHAFEAQELQDDPVAKLSFEREMARLRDWVWLTPFKRGLTPLSRVPGLEQTLFNYYTRGAYDDWWGADFNDYQRYFDRHADVPGTYSSGWYDPYAVAAANHYTAMAKKNDTPQRLILGPWTHETMRDNRTWAADVDFGPDSSIGYDGYNALRLQWFDCWLLGIENDVEERPPVMLFTMGGGDGRKTINGKMSHGGSWRAEQEWPLSRAIPTTLYLRSTGSLTSETPGEAEPSSPSSRLPVSPSLTFTYDPAHPVPTISANVTGFFELVPVGDHLDEAFRHVVPWRARMKSIVNPGATHQREAEGIVGARPPYPLLAHRPDVLVFQTDPLEEAIEVTGQATVTLWVSSSAPDTDFTAKLLDVYPPNPDYPEGYQMNLVDSIIRCRYRESWGREVFMEPGGIYQVNIVLPPTSNRFMPGHRIRLDISSSNFPRFDLNPNTGEPMGRHTHTVPARNTVWLDADYPSHIVLPVIPG